MKTSKLKLFAVCLIALITTTARAQFSSLTSKSTQTTVELTATLAELPDELKDEGVEEYGFEYCVWIDAALGIEHWESDWMRVSVIPDKGTIKKIISNLAPGYFVSYKAYIKTQKKYHYYTLFNDKVNESNGHDITLTNRIDFEIWKAQLKSSSITLGIRYNVNNDNDDAILSKFEYTLTKNGDYFNYEDFQVYKDGIHPNDAIYLTFNNLTPDTKYKILFRGTVNDYLCPLSDRDGENQTIYYFSTNPITVSPTFSNITQTKASMKTNIDAGDEKVTGLKYRLNDGKFQECSETMNFDGLKPNTRYKVSFQGYVNDSLYNWPKDPEDKNYIFRTDDISVSAKASEVYQTSALINFSYDYGDATYVSSGVEYCKKDYYSWTKEIISEKGEVRLTYLNPDDDYEWWAFLETKEGGKKYRKGVFKTIPLTCKTLPASCISNRSATLNGTISCDSYSSPEFGFEWKQMEGWYSNPAFTKGVKAEDGSIAVALVNGMLLPNTDYEYRTVVRFNGETCYQSEWKNFRTQLEFQYYPPSVYTLFRTDRENNRLVLCGYYVAGSENVATQGYEYWNTASSAPAKRVYTGTNGVFQITTDESMQYDLDLSTLADGNYAVRAFVTTSSGGTTYGETLYFGVNSGSASGINRTETKEVTFSTSNQTLTIKDATNMSCTVYNLHGQIVDCRQHMTEYEQFHLTAGIVYIVKLSNGKTFKVLI